MKPIWLFLVSVVMMSTKSNALTITSTSFHDGDTVPIKYTCDGAGETPHISWKHAPAGTKSLALVMRDPDAPSGEFIHWLVANIPADATSLADVDEAKLVFGKNSAHKKAYMGPCPPESDKAHRYIFELSALDKELHLRSGYSYADLTAAMRGHTIEQTRLTATYKRKK